MTKYFILIFLVIVGAISLLYFRIGVLPVYQENSSDTVRPHLQNDPNQSIENISIVAFYFIPRDKTKKRLIYWHQALQNNLDKLAEFHSLQLQGFSNINFEIYPTPIIGRYNRLTYDTVNTQYGNPNALRKVGSEIEERVLRSNGDLYLPTFGQTSVHEYQVWYIMYEGVGSAGSDNVAFISAAYLTDPQYSSYGITYFTHEFYHTLGLADGYETPSNTPFTNDIMGLGRLKPIDKTFISRDNLHQLGI